MEEIIAPVSKELLKAELTADKRLRYTNKSHNEIYVVTWQDSPNVLREIGRLREIAFRAAGGGTGMSLDLDDFDMMEEPYKQLIVWDPDVEAILGGYRYLLGGKGEAEGGRATYFGHFPHVPLLGKLYEKLYALYDRTRTFVRDVGIPEYASRFKRPVHFGQLVGWSGGIDGFSA